MKEAVKKARLGLAATAMLMVSLDVVTAADVQPATLTLKSTEASYELWGASYVKPTGLQMIKRAGYFSPDNGDHFYSPSACSHLRRHSSGRYFWIGNISPTNPQGNHPRWPLVIGEVDSQSLKLIKSTVLEIDTQRPDEAEDMLILSHMWALEDRVTRDIVIVGRRRFFKGNRTSTPVTYRIGVQ